MMKPILCLRENVDLEMLLRLREQLLKDKKRLEQAAERFALIGNDTRLSILWLIDRAKEKEICPCDLADILGITVPAVSQQLQRLKYGRLVVNRREGKTIFYSLTSEGRNVLKQIEPNSNKEQSNG